MRGLGWMVILSVGGCTALNDDYSNAAGSSTTGVPKDDPSDGEPRPTATSPSVESDTASGGATSDADDSDSSVPTTGTSENPSGPGPGMATGAETGDWATSGGTSGGRGSSETGLAETGSFGDEHVLFVYATTAPFNFPKDPPELACVLDEPGDVSLRCVGGPRFPLVSTAGTSIPQALNAIEALGLDVEVHGIFSDGSQPLASHPAAMLTGLEVSLSEGDVNLEEKESFWTGVGGNCQNWTAFGGTATVGSASSTDGAWFNADDVTCDSGLPILCACESVANPFD